MWSFHSQRFQSGSVAYLRCIRRARYGTYTYTQRKSCLAGAHTSVGRLWPLIVAGRGSAVSIEVEVGAPRQPSGLAPRWEERALQSPSAIGPRQQQTPQTWSPTAKGTLGTRRLRPLRVTHERSMGCDARPECLFRVSLQRAVLGISPAGACSWP